MTFVDDCGFGGVAILVLHVCYANKCSTRSEIDDERQTIDAQTPYVCVYARSFALDGRRERREMNDDGLNETRRR